MPGPGQSGNRFVSTPEHRSFSPALVDKPAVLRKTPAERVQSDVPLISVLLVDPRPLTAEAVCTYLESAARSGVVARFHVFAATPDREFPTDKSFDLLLLHTSSSTNIGDEIERCLATIPADFHNLPTVVYSDCSDAVEIAAAMRHGAHGYLPSTLESDAIVEALRLVASGLAVFPPAALSRLSGCQAADERGDALQGAATSATSFTARERDVLEGLHAGKPNKAIAYDLGVSQSTVKVHVRSVFKKLGVRNRTEAAMVSGEYFMTHPSP